jgi:hypothetical protein
MATKNFTISKDASVVYTGSGQNLGQGAGDNVAVGYISSTGWLLRGLMEFNLDFSGVTAITSATLYVQAYNRPGQNNTIWEMGSGMDIYRNTSAWSEGTRGADGVWYSTNAVTWANKPAYTSTGFKRITTAQIPNATPDLGDVYALDVTDIVRSWAPVTVTGGSGSANHGITLKMVSETSANGGGVEFRTKEDSAINGGSSYAGAFIVLTYDSTTAPTATPSEPTTTGEVASIYNLGDTELTWSETSKTALPVLAWSYVANGGGAQTSWRVRIYDNSTGGSTIFDSGTVTASGYQNASSLNVPRYNNTAGGNTDYVATYCPGPTALQGTLPDNGGIWASGYDGLEGGDQYWWNVEVTSAAGLTSTATTRYPFKVRWGQDAYYFDLGVSYASTAEHQTTINAATGGAQAVRLYASSSSSTVVPTAWYSSLTAAAPASARYMWVLVRLAQNANATGAPSVSGLDALWNSSSTQPDGWAIDTTAGAHALALSPSHKRFGTRAAKFTVNSSPGITASGSISAYRNSAGDGVPVSPDTVYTFSCYVYDNGDAGVGTSGIIKLKVFQGGRLNAVLDSADLLVASDPHTSFLAVDKEPATGIGWRRMSVTFSSGGNSVIRPAVECTNFTNGKIIFVDGALVEEGSVIRSYTPGTVNSPAVVEGMGVQVDAAAGGKMRLRGSSGLARDIVQLGANGLNFGANTPVSIYQTADNSNSLTVSGALAASSTITQNGTAVSTVGHTHTQAESHNTPDTDSATSSLHHTIGTSATQAAAGNHAHSGTTLALTGDLTLAATTITVGAANSLSVAVNNDSHTHGSSTISGLVLGTDVSGTYVAGITAGTGVSVSGTAGSGWSPTVAIGQSVSTAASPTFAGLTSLGTTIFGDSSSDQIRATSLFGTTDITNSQTLRIYTVGNTSPSRIQWRIFRETSSERFKVNILPMPDSEEILQIQPSSYYDKAQYEANPDTATLNYGLIAEQMEQNSIGSKFVSHNEDGLPETVQYEKLVVPLLSAMRSLQARIQELEAKIAEIEGRE